MNTENPNEGMFGMPIEHQPMSTETPRNPCGKCGFSLDGYYGLRHFGTYTAHLESDCIALMRTTIAARDREIAMIEHILEAFTLPLPGPEIRTTQDFYSGCTQTRAKLSEEISAARGVASGQGSAPSAQGTKA